MSAYATARSRGLPAISARDHSLRDRSPFLREFARRRDQGQPFANQPLPADGNLVLIGNFDAEARYAERYWASPKPRWGRRQRDLRTQ